ncbi:hypothetical protein H0H92_000036 [Tricholoma furcatifolium]|nr:hypothetical protein H0H92_000036 [Tricholoma furcatifolium]
MTRYIERTAPKEYVESMTPTYAPGCKRIILDPGYLESLHRPNVSLSWEEIKGFVAEGIELKSGKVVPLDVVIFGTGFSLGRRLVQESNDIEIRGSKGMTLREYHASQGGPTAYLGTCSPGFPNCFTLLGPNVATGHASVIFSQEAQIGLAIQLIKPVLEGKAKSFEVTEEATDKYNDWLQKRLSGSVWTDCNSYYRLGEQKKIIATFPGPVSLFWWMTLRPQWKDFIGVGAAGWEKERRRDLVKKWIVVGGFLVLIGGWLKGQMLVEVVKRIVSTLVVV